MVKRKSAGDGAGGGRLFGRKSIPLYPLSPYNIACPRAHVPTQIQTKLKKTSNGEKIADGGELVFGFDQVRFLRVLTTSWPCAGHLLTAG